jgi:hypothetical protein
VQGRIVVDGRILLGCDDRDLVMQAKARRATNPGKAGLRLIAAPLLMFAVACVHDRSSRPVTAEPAAIPSASAPVATTPPAPQPEAGVTNSAPQTAPSQTNAPTGPPPTPAKQSPGGQSGSATARTRPPNARANLAATPRAPVTSAVPPASAPVVAASPPPSGPPLAAASTLDLKGLEQRLRDTHAIGLFTKLSLKNQVDDLLAQFKAFHQGQSRNTLAQLRREYELLLMRVVSLLQDGDPALASAILSSREAIWGILSDPRRFAAV